MTRDLGWSTLYTEHPIRPVEGIDPVASDAGRQSSVTEFDVRADRPSIGYSCLWEPVPARTWSGSAWHLREALRQVADVVDIGVRIPGLARTLLKGAHTSYRGGRFTTSWCTSRVTDAYNSRALRQGISKNFADRPCDAVLMIDSLAAVSQPYFVYYDSSWDALIAGVNSLQAYASLRLISPTAVARRRDLQLAVYERAAGVVTMSHWLARCLIEQSGVAQSKVHVVHPGYSAGRDLTGSGARTTEASQPVTTGLRSPRERAAPRHRLLFVGRQYEVYDFYRKAGDLVVAALDILRRHYDSRITLTMVGMKKWPLPGSPPDGVSFLGVRPPDEVAALYDSHDLFVMPSRMEPFGIAFAEALSHGLPCIGRNAYAMPEIITPGVSGALISGDDPEELASTIAATLANDQIYESCHERAPKMAGYFSWERAAREMLSILV